MFAPYLKLFIANAKVIQDSGLIIMKALEMNKDEMSVS